MTVSFDIFTEAFLQKITEYRFLAMEQQDRQDIVDGYLRRACADFSSVCKEDLSSLDSANRFFLFRDNMSEAELEEIVDIISEGMIVQWLKPYTYKQENLENMLNTTDFTSYSPAELLKRVVEAYNTCKKDYVQKVREYSYRHGDLTVLHL